jgi:hypothetical protein
MMLMSMPSCLVYYNLAITGLPVAICFLIGDIETLGLIPRDWPGCFSQKSGFSLPAGYTHEAGTSPGGDVSRATARTRSPSARRAAAIPTAPRGPQRAEARRGCVRPGRPTVGCGEERVAGIGLTGASGNSR